MGRAEVRPLIAARVEQELQGAAFIGWAVIMFAVDGERSAPVSTLLSIGIGLLLVTPVVLVGLLRTWRGAVANSPVITADVVPLGRVRTAAIAMLLTSPILILVAAVAAAPAVVDGNVIAGGIAGLGIALLISARRVARYEKREQGVFVRTLRARWRGADLRLSRRSSP